MEISQRTDTRAVSRRPATRFAVYSRCFCPTARIAPSQSRLQNMTNLFGGKTHLAAGWHFGEGQPVPPFDSTLPRIGGGPTSHRCPSFGALRTEFEVRRDEN